jgi:hypothetical protein
MPLLNPETEIQLILNMIENPDSEEAALSQRALYMNHQSVLAETLTDENDSS